ncbi:uncharacterized protein Eint_050120 [Encephalitozoon intestinalis ATCC 50506]|uniref:Uncharacterized protein n=1 Tax=Encephalitozoon intestinalis (strain ATCC 50506) TaxID=876142 RepID=E0S733_ENCIT|nr:uncharacterized protein Eint_050120 [Encephalitozoon intestinalis ATCC 50506]ADM11461.1 hypothetical protein Eint_050120 [Encephalitozoon intestinalis ATCC 50506]UTX45172.1 hypothetical protein GPK93_05g07160 [Encephalitozoon intestinalis]
MNKKSFLRIFIITILALGITLLAFFLLREKPLGYLTEEDVQSLSSELQFRFKDSGKNEDGNEVTDVKFFVCLNSILKLFNSVEISLINTFLSYGEKSSKGEKKEEEDYNHKGLYVKSALQEARNIMFLSPTSKEAIVEILQKENEKKKESELLDTVRKAFSEVQLSPEEDDDSSRQKKEELNKVLANLFIWFWLKGTPPADKRINTFKGAYESNQDIKKYLLEYLDEENKEVANATISVSGENEVIPVIDHILLSIFNASIYMGLGISPTDIPAATAILAAGGILEKEGEQIKKGFFQGLQDFFFGSPKQEQSLQQSEKLEKNDG